MGWFGGTEVVIVVAVVALCVVPFLWLFIRRRVLSSRGGVFDCAMRVEDGVRSSRWHLGLALYEGDRLCWYRAFGATLRPSLVIDRHSGAHLGRRAPDAAENLVLFSDHEIVRIKDDATGGKTYELAMTGASLTGMLSWLEASLPGGGRYPGGE